MTDPVAPSDTLVFEDTVLGVQSGRAAGMRVCGVITSESSEGLIAAGAFEAIADFCDLPQTITSPLGL